MLEAKLVIVGGEAKAGEVRLELPTTIGRGKEADLTIPHALVSRSHSKLFERDGHLWVEDLGSLNGTFVNNTRIESEQLIEPNQLLTLGNITFRAVYHIEQSTRRTLPSTALPDSMQTVRIDPLAVLQTVSEPALRDNTNDDTEVAPQAKINSLTDAESASVFEEPAAPRSAISEIDSFDPDEIGSLDSARPPQNVNQQQQPPNVKLPQKPSKPASPIAPARAVTPKQAKRPSSPPKKSLPRNPAPAEEVSIDLGIDINASRSQVSSVDLNLDVANDVQAAPVSFIGQIETGDADSPSLIDNFQIDVGSDDDPEVDVDAIRLDSFLKKLPK